MGTLSPNKEIEHFEPVTMQMDCLQKSYIISLYAAADCHWLSGVRCICVERLYATDTSLAFCTRTRPMRSTLLSGEVIWVTPSGIVPCQPGPLTRKLPA